MKRGIGTSWLIILLTLPANHAVNKLADVLKRFDSADAQQ